MRLLRDVVIVLEGTEVAKWLTQRYKRHGAVTEYTLHSSRVVVTSANVPTYRDLGPRAESDLPYLGEDARVEFRFMPGVLSARQRSAARAVEEALRILNADTDGIAHHADRVAVEVMYEDVDE